MKRKIRRLLGGPTIVTVLALTALLMGLAGCSDDNPTVAPAGNGDSTTGVFHVGVDDDADFEIISLKNGDPEDPIEGPFAILGRNVHYDTENGALVMDLSVKNLGDDTFDEPIMLTFLSLLPDGVTVLNPDNDENGAGAAIVFEFENDDAMWTPGEESLGRETRFGVDQGVSIGFVARLDAGIGGDVMGSVGGMVWDDANGDGIMDDGEAGVPGATLELSAEGMDALTTQSGEDGTYRFDGLPMGFYQVEKMPIEGMAGTTPARIYVVLVAEDGTVYSFLAANFGCMADEFEPTGIIMGKVWNDLNGDGVIDDGEPFGEGIEVQLSGDAADTTTTAEDGSYSFEGLAAGSYSVVSIGPEGWVLTTGSPIQVILETDDSVFDGANFGWIEETSGGTAIIKGKVWNDLNGDGMVDDGEPGLEGIAVNLSGDATGTTSTLSDGTYAFEGLSAGDYRVTSSGPAGWVLTTAELINVTLTTDDEIYNDASFGWMEEVTGGQAIINGKVWNDLNGDGILDDGEPGLEGITVNLTSSGVSETATTLADGSYAFEGLSAASYSVACTGPEGWTATTATVIPVILNSDDEVFSDASFGWMEDTGGR